MSENSIFEVKKPCSEEWDEMAGNDHVRFCSHCSKDVNNISEMTRKEAMRLVRNSNGSLCVRYVKHPVTSAPVFSNMLHQISRRAALPAGVLGASLALATPAFAQGEPITVQTIRAQNEAKSGNTSSRLSGNVTDQNGAAIGFAVVSLTNTETGEYRVIIATAEGFYEFTDLPAGTYKLKIEAGGFEAKEISSIYLSESSELRSNEQLAIPQIAEVVQVGGNEKEVTEWVLVGSVGTLVSIEARNPLVQAVFNEDFDEVKVHVNMRSKVNVKDKAYDGITPLHAAVETGNVEIAAFLLSRGAKVNIRDFQKRTPIMMADEEAKPEMFQLLISYGAKLNLVDKQRNNALHYIVSADGQSDWIRSLIVYGVDLNAINKLGKTPLMIAAESESEANVKVLIENGAIVNTLDREKLSAWDLTSSQEIKRILETYGSVTRQD
ncbi:MAG: ankyrin repeat domain-containing protein [Blastocatellia bacterium]